MKTDVTELLEQIAAAGGQEHMDELVRKVQPRVRAYILRCTLNEDLTEDIVQETMLQLLVSLKSLKNRERFWPWLFKIASNKIISHFRREKYRTSVRFSAMEDHVLESALEDTAIEEADEQPVLQEMVGLIVNGMNNLTPSQRSVLSLRCFEGMQYQEIAEAVGCSESTARVQFLRARNKVKSALTRGGLSRKAVLPALVLFGKLTAGQDALAASITPATVTLESGLSIGQALLAGLKAYYVQTAAVTTAAAMVLMATHAVWVRSHPHPYPQRENVQSVHYTVQGIGLLQEDNAAVAVQPANRSRKADVDSGPYYSKGAYEQWLQFPAGPDGPVLVRMQRWSIDKKDKLCGWLQNGRAHYYYHSGENRIYITNDPIGMLILPTDSPEMVEFLIDHTSYQDKIRYKRDRKTQLLTAKVDNRVPSVKDYTTDYAYNTLSETDFEPFWPEDAGVVDQRDAMHYRGWTYFTIDGLFDNFPIRGKGRIPFSYHASIQHTPWLDVTVGDSLRLIDTPQGACMIDQAAGQTVFYPAGTFFIGLGRPWTGIRAFDSLRRDAAAERICFAAKRIDETSTVQLQHELGPDTYRIRYTVDMYKDVISSIAFSRTGSNPAEGQLTLTYAQQLEDLPGPFEQPQLPGPGQPQTAAAGAGYWLMSIVQTSPTGIDPIHKLAATR